MIDKLRKKFPHMKIGLSMSEVMSADDLVEKYKEIKSLNIDIVWVSLGPLNKNSS